MKLTAHFHFMSTLKTGGASLPYLRRLHDTVHITEATLFFISMRNDYTSKVIYKTGTYSFFTYWTPPILRAVIWLPQTGFDSSYKCLKWGFFIYISQLKPLKECCVATMQVTHLLKLIYLYQNPRTQYKPVQPVFEELPCC
jgi:hypothetical protein